MYGVAMRVKGKYACFTRPEFKAERVSYDVMTPSAARGILEAVHWKPAIVWRVDRIHVLNPIRFETLRRNEVGAKVPVDSVKSAMKNGGDLSLFVEDNRAQRGAQLLRDVDYVVEAHFEMSERAGPDDNPAKHIDIFRRRLAKGQCHHAPCLGCREFAAEVEAVDAEEIPASAMEGEKDLSWMLYDMDYAVNGGGKGGGAITPAFFRAKLVNGVLHVPAPDSAEVCR